MCAATAFDDHERDRKDIDNKGMERSRRRFRRPRPLGSPPDVEGDETSSLQAELMLLREENARLKAAQLQRDDVSRLLGRARSLPSSEVDPDSLSDDTAQMLVDGLVIRESLFEICQEIERLMCAFGARLDALASTPLGAAGQVGLRAGGRKTGPRRASPPSRAPAAAMNGHDPTAA
jgi:hypothetical protein